MKKLGWIRFKSGGAMKKFYSVIQTNSAYNAPFDTARKLGAEKKKQFLKELIPTSESYTNPFAQQFGVFKLNVIQPT